MMACAVARGDPQVARVVYYVASCHWQASSVDKNKARERTLKLIAGAYHNSQQDWLWPPKAVAIRVGCWYIGLVGVVRCSLLRVLSSRWPRFCLAIASSIRLAFTLGAYLAPSVLLGS